ncbi:hypothetical protein GCM10011609_15500 [Lentzea pudingi]|uniref:Uncharacterized protein n=1 Tax=Lentzea pudingi TaxID=1789439 RepID=A0ABQ2HG38_9PSEU|nr:hypothetical protein GCM10011609_15500 [Lentzea pudingi]
MTRHQNFTSDELAVITQGPGFLHDQSERECPGCGRTSVRSYVRKSVRAGHPSLVKYTWCASCGRFAGSTGAYPRGLTIYDRWQKAEPDDWKEFDLSLTRMFRRLDRLWQMGVLPQRFGWE